MENAIKIRNTSIPFHFQKKITKTRCSSVTLSSRNIVLLKKKSFLIKGNDCVMQITTMNIKPTM